MIPLSKTQVDQLGDRLRKGNILDDDLRLLDAYRGSFGKAYQEVVATVQRTAGLVREPTGRPEKTKFSIIEKLQRETKMRLSRMQDIAGCRMVVADIVEQDLLVESLARAFAKVKVYDRRERPSHGYRAVHVIAMAQNKPVEIQVRTELQHLWAEQSEKMSDSDPRIKYGGGDPDAQGLLLTNSTWIADIEKEEQALAERKQELAERKGRLLKNLKNLNEIIAALPQRVN